MRANKSSSVGSAASYTQPADQLMFVPNQHRLQILSSEAASHHYDAVRPSRHSPKQNPFVQHPRQQPPRASSSMI